MNVNCINATCINIYWRQVMGLVTAYNSYTQPLRPRQDPISTPG